MPRRILIKDGGLSASTPMLSGYTVIGSDNGIIKKQVVSTIGNLSGSTHYIGEQFGGGVVFHLWLDDYGLENVLIVSNTHIGAANWSNVGSSIGSSARSYFDGLSNSNAIVAQVAHSSSAAKSCLDLISNDQNDWYLPSIDELSLLYQNKFNVNKTLTNIVGSNVIGNVAYWSSTEFSSTDAMYFNLGFGTLTTINKTTTTMFFRPVRKFTI